MTALLKGSLRHWGAVFVVGCVLVLAGLSEVHVRQFNVFLFVVLGLSLALVLLVATTDESSREIGGEASRPVDTEQ